MPDSSRHKGILLRLVPILGIGLLAYLISKLDFHALAANAKAIAWGLLLIIALGGLSHMVKTCAWLLTLRGERHKVSFARAFGLRLASEAIGQLGFLGMVGGETARVSLLGSGVSLPAAISSVTLDRGLFIIAGAVVTLAGIAGIGFAVPLPHSLRLYAVALAIGLVCLLAAGAIAILRRWPVLSASARAIAWFPALKKWLASRESTIIASEQRIVAFYHDAPQAFWSSVLLNFCCHFLAIVEVYICLRILGAHATLAGALIMESLTKLVNVAGSVNPGNVGTYEAGNMAVGKLVRLTGAEGLLLALCRRARAVFWSIIGGICLLWLSKKRNRNGAELSAKPQTSAISTPAQDSFRSLFLCETVFILAHDPAAPDQFEPALATVATLPLLLRTILGVRGKERVRTVLVLNPDNYARIRAALLATCRVPAAIEWLKVPAGTPLPTILQTAGLNGGHVAFISARCSYRPNLLRAIHEWDGEGGAFEFVSAGSPIGLAALAPDVAARLTSDSEAKVKNEQDLHAWITEKLDVHVPGQCPYREVDEESWQTITRPQDCIVAERKLDRWLVKSTDGVFARMNRRVSIPISHRLIKFPITPNMVSLFTLALSLAAGVFFAAGGYWNCLAGAILGVLTSILDGCDGEVARLKLQVSDFGCWMDTLCDYLYYIVTFAGITIGLVRSKGEPSFAGWGVAMFAGAFMTFLMAGIGRKRLTGDRPEQYLQVWQKNAEKRSAGLMMRLARQTEFIVRRCFLPYLVLVLALFNLIPLFLYMAAFGANVAWIVSLRSLIAFSSGPTNKFEESSSTRPETPGLIAQVSDSTL
jgi:phosphatidylglycerophosphate synthase